VENNLIISYLTLRKLIGLLGISLAGLCVAGGILLGSGEVEPSISAYYTTNMRDLFVGILMIAGAFLLTYQGYDRTDNILSSVAGVAAIGVAIFPLDYVEPGNIFGLTMPAVGVAHYIAAMVLFAALGYIALFQFTKGSTKTAQKRRRNTVYRICGITIFVSLLLMLFEGLVPALYLGTYFVLIIESIMLIAFGISWLVKGETFLTDNA